MRSPEKSVPTGKSFAITTSWDDGHPLDLRVAELLAKYGVRGTFYVPLHNSRPTMSPAQIREISASFEIGAHTVNHLRLNTLNQEQAKREIGDSKRCLEDILGEPCSVFCFPGGRYTTAHLRMVRDAEFCGVRTTELLSFQRPQTTAGISVIPTTVQVFPHRTAAYLRNAFKRLRPGAFRNLLLGLRTSSWSEFAELLLARVAQVGGVFHLWGHSWEIEEAGQWQALDQILAAISQYERCGCVVTNSELCQDYGTLTVSS